MKRIYLAVVLYLVFGASAFSQSAKHVILISIDGFRPDFYRDSSWPAPNLQKLLAEGVYAEGVNSVFPSVTYPSHTTLVTGALPARHGVYYNSPYGAAKGQWYWESNYIKTPTLWDAVKKAGMKSGSIMWPVTVGAPIDFNFPVRRADEDEQTDQLSITRPLVSPATLLDDIEKATNTKFKRSDFNHDNLDRTVGRMANHIIATQKPNLMAIHFLSMDHAGHSYGRDGNHIRESLVLVDSLVGAVLKTVEKAGIKNQTAIIITGDHGMVTRTTSLSPNVWLAQNGLLGNNGWKAKFHPAGGAAFLYLKDKNDTETLRKVQQLLANLPAHQKKLFRVVDRKEMDAVGANPEPVLALAFAKGVAYGGAQEGEAVKPAKKGGTHGYFPDFQEIRTGFIATGAGINKGVVIKQMGVQDVAPVVARLLGLDFKAPDGTLHSAILRK
ncbi:alkaline phosphatase family protein [Botryobacter ruber]|uniref:alkaline phosphatase family protein n=1 Tax=Botryobacter ruber TaxID=2171629 RepID=UPI000E0C78BB|nr:ectonucleotide pyrophosphatase/phosphodiesterase [Botryobacter ruber]